MKIKDFYQEITKFCIENSDERIAKKYARFFKEGYDAYGINPEVFEKWFKSNLERIKTEFSKDQIIELCSLLFKSGKYEEGGYAIWCLKAYKTKLRKTDLPIIKNWLENDIKNWAHTDVLCIEIISDFIIEEIEGINYFLKWINSPSKWARRAIPVTFIKLINTHKIQDLLLILHELILDKDIMVQKALGWFLREAWKKYPPVIEKYLLKIKNHAGRTIIQYATEKMSKEEKLKYKKQKN